MAFKNFVPNVWSAEIMAEVDRLCVFAEDCNRDFEGSIKNVGESVKINGVGSPTITVVTKGQRKSQMPAREEIEDTSVIMYINQMAIFNYGIDDIDAAQMSGNVKSKLNKKTSARIASEMDKRIAAVCAGKEVPKLFTAKKKLVSGTAGTGEINILTMIDVALQRLYEQDVPSTGAKIVVTLSPGAHRLYVEAYGKDDTDNHELMKNGRVGMYHGAVIKMSNNTYKDAAGEHISVRTTDAVAFANPLTHTEAYRPEDGFEDAIKGYSLYDAMVVLPKEILDVLVEVPAFE